jgi:N-acetylglutamate synthase-like GNAT family acetyltransferase
MLIRTIQHGSTEYGEMIKLRIHELLRPIGVPEHYIQQQNEVTDFLVAAFDEEVMIGCCVLTPRAEGLIQLRQMAVKESLRGQNIGAAIVAFAENLAREKGFSKLMMHARNPVIPFYLKSGYSIVGDEFFEVGIGHRRMEKELANQK